MVPDIYYRAGEWAPFDPATVFTDKQERARLSSLASVLTNDRILADAGAYADFLLARPEVAGPAIGTTGYCLGGRMSVITAGGLGHTIAAAASFHGGRLAVAGDPSSPHLSAGRITAKVYVAAAQDDDSFTAEQAMLLASALADAGVDHVLEFYPARHGFAVPDNLTYDEDADARHWEALGALYRACLRDPAGCRPARGPAARRSARQADGGQPARPTAVSRPARDAGPAQRRRCARRWPPWPLP